MALDFDSGRTRLIAENGHTVFYHHATITIWTQAASSKRRRPAHGHTCSGLYFYRDVHLSESGFCLSSKEDSHHSLYDSGEWYVPVEDLERGGLQHLYD